MDTLKELQALIQRKYGIEPSALEPTASIRGAGLDSLALVEFLFEVEDEFHVSLPEQPEEVDTLAELAVLVDRLRVSARAAA